MTTLFVRALVLLLLVLPAQSAPLSGTKTIGPTGDYASIGAAITDIQTQTLSGALVLELQPSYLSSVETFPVTFTNLGTTAANTVTLRPQTGAVGLAISSANTTVATVDLNGAQFLTIDGRPGGAGTASQLNIANTSASGRALRFINEASNNIIRYIALKGVNTSATSGTVVFSTTTGTNGNDNNTLDHCDICDGASTPANGLYALGTITTTAQNNSSNTVSNCNIFNFYATTAIDAAGVRLDSGNTDWTFTGNSFYQTASRAAVGAFVRPIYLNNTSGYNFTVTGNFVGGRAPNAGGAAWATTGTLQNYRFVGIQLNVGTTTPSSVQGNTLQNMVWTSGSGVTTLPGVWSGIYLQTGAVNLGTVSGNIIGNATGTGSVSVTTSGGGGTTFGIGSDSSGAVTIANNTVGSITANGSAASVSGSLVGIQVTSGANTISGNTVGSTITANSLNAATLSTDTTFTQQVTGILSSSTTSASIADNTVANLNNNYNHTLTSGQIRGIVTSSGGNTITGNIVRNLSTTSRNANAVAAQSVYGILQTATTAGQTVSQNIVHSLANTAVSAAVSVTGIYFSGPTSGTNVIARNLVHSLAVSSTSTSSVVNGMYIGAGMFNAQNNMVRVGINAAGASTAGASNVRGIYDNGTDAGRNFYHNSVHVGGAQSSGATNTLAFTSSGSSNARAFQNNLFVNARSNSSGTGKHYAVNYGGTIVNPTGLTAGGNIFFVSGTGGVLGFYNSADRTALAAWQTATGQDVTSAVVDPLFVNATGDATAVDMHLQASNPAEGSGLVIAAVADDFDGQIRGSLTPADIGADAGNFTVSSDVFAPAISYLPLTSGTTSNRTLTGFATITDNVGVAGGVTAPRLYFKKSTDADVFGVPNDSTGNGWKYVTASNGTSPFSFTMDYSLINGGSVSLGDVIQYFVVAQDATNNLSSSPAGAGAAATPPVQNVNAHATLNSYSIIAAPIGTKTIGPTGDYATISAAISAIQAVGLSGALTLELQAAYVSTAETFPLVFTNLGTAAGNTITLRPELGATGLSISSANTTAATVDLNGATFLTIDGRPGGMGTVSQLSISNTSTSGRALRFINEASNNTVRYTTLRGVNTSGTSGVVVFSTTTGANGNDNNTLDHCDISDGASLPVNGLYTLGTTTTTAQNNSGNTVSNCNIFNFYAATASDAAGVRLDDGNTDWTLTGNSFYQTASRTVVGAFVRPIYLNSTSGNNFTVTGNLIGGSAPNAGGAAWTTTGTSAAYRFVGIQLNVGTTTPSNVQGNIIQNIVWTSSANNSTLSGVWSGIYIQAGAASLGTVTGNTIGTGTGTGSITVTTSGNFATTFGISSGSSSAVAIANNSIGSISTNGTGSTISVSLVGIQVTAGANTISGNTIGSTITANSLNAATSSTLLGQQVAGILSSSTISASITGNTVANLNNNFAGTANDGQIRGIVTSAGANTIISNTVRNLSTTSQNANIYNSASVIGIFQFSSSAGQTVSQNVVHSLANTAASAGVWVTGIYYTGATSGTNVIARNWVHSLAVSSTSASSNLIGMQFDAGSFTAQNNMVRVGINAVGTSTAGASNVYGIWDGGSDVGRNFYHNSGYIDGTQTSGTASTYAFINSGVNNARSFQNNIFVNGRGNSGGTGKHYAVQYGGTTVNPTGLTAGGNIYFASGAGGVLGRYNSADRTTLALWRTATGQDATSAAVNPLFVNATGDATAVDLHLQASNPGESGALPITAVTDDFDGQTRSGLTPTDIGADAENFTSSSGDIYAPAISYQTLTSGSTANRTLTGFAVIADNVGVAGGANAPRLYYKKSTDAEVFDGNTSAANGWKYVAASNSTSPFSFTIDYSLLYNGVGGSGSATPGDTIQYFVVAQDAANNLGSSPAGTGAAASPPVQNLNAKPSAGVKSYSIVPIISGTKTVGVGGDYSSLGGAGGLFAAINGSVVTGNLVINITSDLAEDGSNGLNEFNANEYPPSAVSVTIQPGSATMKTISGTSASGLVRLNGADRVIIDGRYGGTGRYLTFRNSSTSSFSNTILLINDASNNTVRSCIVEGATSSFIGVVGLSTGVVTGNDNNLITDNQVRDLSSAAGVPFYLIGSIGSSQAIVNSDNTISNNELFNFSGAGAVIDSTGNESWTISGNNIYEINPATFTVYGIRMNGVGTNVITGNYIHDLLTTGSQSYGITFSGISTTTVSRNRITNFSGSAGTTSVYGIYASGGTGSTLNVVNNQITLVPAATINRTIYGFLDQGSSGSVCYVFYNSILIGGISSANFTSGASLRSGATTHVARNNIFFNSRTGGTGSHFAAGSETTGGSYIANYNVYSGTGATPASFMDFSATSGTPVPVTFATWQTSTGGDANSQASNPGGNFTTAMFMNVAAGDLHLVPGGNPLVSATGTPVAGITDDYDGESRDLIAPDIGADEFASNNANLSALDLSSGTLTPVFASSTLTYTVTVANAVSSITVTPTVADATAAVKVNNIAVVSGSASGAISLAVGVNSISVVVTAQDGATTSPYTVTVTRQSATESWRQTYFGSTSNSGNAADSFDFDKDGLPNLIEWACNLNPTTASTLPITTTRNGAVFEFAYTRSVAALNAGTAFTVEWSDDLPGSSWSTTGVTENILSDNGTVQQVKATLPAGSTGHRFVHLKVTAPP
ncbi:cadherin-like beta sandwich domain-containing protein [Prosthecobacter sp.]|uniref:beta strand repeat-containing protein n=1 Tax=Prosthecobacter sp. TaxID=1965333 RepID=UPI002ABB0186|nr:cadherin-like beta sandwich domain-containing protein [Prosthecobacter sp.]MDZ4403704.1 cadherin-like beta sandwich domain-containing protein [Prosthecobacter sp.]